MKSTDEKNGESCQLLPIKSDGGISSASDGSFDWNADERASSDFQDEYGDDTFTNDTVTPDVEANSGAFCFAYGRILRSRMYHLLAVVVFFSSISVFVAHWLQLPLPSIYRVPLYHWAIVSFWKTLGPCWIYAGLCKLGHFFETSPYVGKTELSVRLESVRGPLTFAMANSILGILWTALFPFNCQGEAGGEEGFCLYAHVPKILFFYVICGVVLTVNYFLLSLVKSSFQERSFKKRIIELRFRMHIVDRLLQAARNQKMARHANMAQATKRSFLQMIMYDLPMLIPESIIKSLSWIVVVILTGRIAPTKSSETMKMSKSLTGTFSEYRSMMTDRINHVGCQDAVQPKIPQTDHEAKAMAHQVFHYLVPKEGGRKCLVPKDFEQIIPNENAAHEAYYIFDADRDGTISKAEFKGAVVRIYREARNLMQSVANTGSALTIFDTISAVIVWVGLALILLGLYGVKAYTILGMFGSFAFGFNFIIYDAANKTFHAILLLFVIHPYDVGDQIIPGKEVGLDEAEVLTVTSINIQNTLFRRWNGDIISIPNHILALGSLTNLSRNHEQWEKVEFAIPLVPTNDQSSFDVQASRLSKLRKRLEAFLATYHHDYYHSFDLKAKIAAEAALSDTDCTMMSLALKVHCKETVDNQKKWTRHARLLAFIGKLVADFKPGPSPRSSSNSDNSNSESNDS